MDIFEHNKKVAQNREANIRKIYEKHLQKISRTRKSRLYKSRLLAFLAGDGCVAIRRNNRCHDIAFYPDNDAMLKAFLEAFQYLYIRIPKVLPQEKHYVVRICHMVACLDLLKTTKFSAKTWRVPFNFLVSRDMKAEWLRAYFDCEAHVAERQIQVQSVNRVGLEQVRILLKEFDIDSRIYSYTRRQKQWNINYILSIMRKESRINYLKHIGFNHSAKQSKLQSYLCQRAGIR